MRPISENEVKVIVYRIFKSNGEVAGTAFLVDDNYLLTCAHVVAVALDKGIDGLVRLGDHVRVDAPCLGSEPFEATVEVFIERTSACATRDIALLRIPSDQSQGLKPAAWLCINLSKNALVKAFGFPEGYPSGGWPEGELKQADIQGWRQVDKLRFHGVPVAGGLSGSPVWNNDMTGVIGMLAASDVSHGVFYVIPFELIRQVCVEKFCLRLIPDNDRDILNYLFKLNYNEQKAVFADFQDQSVCSYIVHGKDGFGQELLAKTIYDACNCKCAEPFKVDFGATRPSVTIDNVLFDLGHRFHLPSPFELNSIISALLKKLRFEDVFIRVQTGHLTDPDGMVALFTEFWQPLVQRVENLPAKPVNKLIMLVLDKKGLRDKWNIKTASAYDPNWIPAIPVELPEIAKFSTHLLKTWLVIEVPSLKHLGSAPFVANKLYQNGYEGIPEWIFNEFCRLFNRSWYGDMEEWLST